MKFFRFILPCMIMLFCIFCSCSTGDMTEEDEAATGKPVVDGEKTPSGGDKTSEDEEDPDEKREPSLPDDDDDDDDNEDEDDDGEIPDDDPLSAVFLECGEVSEREIFFEFSLPVTVVHLQFNPELEIELLEEGSTVTVTLGEDMEPGQRIEVDLSVEDELGNTVDVLFPFRAKNRRVPDLLINELRTEYSKPRAEFIEFRMLSDGNLGALRVFAAGNNKIPQIYEFEPVEVQAGEYAVLHLRTLEEDCTDEYGDSLDESGGTDSSPTARDFWIPGTTKLLRKTDVVYVLDQDDNVLDAVMIAENMAPQWDKDYFAAAAEFLFAKGAWKSASGEIPVPADAVDSSGIKTAITRSISRDETADNTRSAADWFVTSTGGVTPGQPNTPKRL